MPFVNKDNLSRQQLVDLMNEKKNLYFSTKRLCNHTTDVDKINSLWLQAVDYWKEYYEIKQYFSQMTTNR